jgi:cell division protein FtsW (lipid II flippase)
MRAADQSLIESIIESITDTLSGIGISWLAMLYVIPLFYPDYQPDVSAALGIVLLFTGISLARKFFWRRIFATGLHRVVHKFVSRIFRA